MTDNMEFSKGLKRKHKENADNSHSERKKAKLIKQKNAGVTNQNNSKKNEKFNHSPSQEKSKKDITKSQNGVKKRKVHKTYNSTSNGLKQKSEINKKSTIFEQDEKTSIKKTSCDIDKVKKHSVRHKKVLSKRRRKKLTSKQQITGGETIKLHVQPPKNPEEFSSNWKQMLTTLQKTEHKKMSKQAKKPAFRSRLKEDNPDKKEIVSQPTEKQSSQDIWFDDVDEILIDRHKPSIETSQNDKKGDPLVKLGSYTGLTKVVSMDCEMVGVGRDGREDMLARVSIVNQYGHCIYDQYVRPVELVVDYRTHVSGIRKEDLDKGIEFSVVQKEVADILKNRILVGHALNNDLKVLYLSHPKKKIRDTSRYKPFRRLFSGRIPSLKKLTAQVLNVKVQEGEHDSIQDSQAAMRLYTMYRQQWEKDIKSGFPQKQKGKHTNSKRLHKSHTDGAESD